MIDYRALIIVDRMDNVLPTSRLVHNNPFQIYKNIDQSLYVLSGLEKISSPEHL